MSLIPWRPFYDIDNFFDDWDKMDLSVISPIRAPKVDIYEDKGNVVVEAELPGVDPKDIDVEIIDNTLKIEAKTEEKKEEKEKGYYKKEISSGYYKRIISLPSEIKEGKVEASYDKGVLKIVAPKVEPEKESKKKGTKVKIKNKSKSKKIKQELKYI